MTYAKLIDNQLALAPRHYVQDGYQISNPTPEMLTELEYKPVTFTQPPGDAPEGYVWEETWTESAEAIVQGWEAVPEPDEISEERAYRIITGEEE